jgi:hypothetical protein
VVEFDCGRNGDWIAHSSEDGGAVEAGLSGGLWTAARCRKLTERAPRANTRSLDYVRLAPHFARDDSAGVARNFVSLARRFSVACEAGHFPVFVGYETICNA